MNPYQQGALEAFKGAALMVAIVVLTMGGAMWAMRMAMFGKRKPKPVFRRVVKLEDCDGGKVVTMECGHTSHWEVVFPSECKCEVCTREVEALQKMTGVK